MGLKLKNIIILVAIALAAVLFYTFFVKDDRGSETLLSSTGGEPELSTSANPAIAGDFLALLLSVKNITLSDAILSDPAFLSLADSSIELIPEGNEGRPNPFAPIGSDF